jgi:hypothetical protein
VVGYDFITLINENQHNLVYFTYKLGGQLVQQATEDKRRRLAQCIELIEYDSEEIGITHGYNDRKKEAKCRNVGIDVFAECILGDLELASKSSILQMEKKAGV